jgi:hypothetical protein
MEAKREEREAARRLRREGLPLSRIATELGVAKSSVSVWTRDLPRPGAPVRPAEAQPVRRVLVWRSGVARRCSRCRLVLPLEAFNRMGDGRQFYCRECFRSYFRARGDKHREQSGAALVARRRRARAHVLAVLLERPCADCGESDPVVLEFDHVRGKEANLSSLVAEGAKLSRIDQEIARCDVVCVNCHRRRTATRAGWLRARSDWRAGTDALPRPCARNVRLALGHLEASGCADCGSTDLATLDFDHLGAKRFNVMRAVWAQYSAPDIVQEIAGCAVRCANCHRRRTASAGGHFRWAAGTTGDV